MKIIAVDNFDRDEIPNVLVAENVNKYWGDKIVTSLNYMEGTDLNAQYYFLLVDDDHKLWGGMSELV